MSVTIKTRKEYISLEDFVGRLRNMPNTAVLFRIAGLAKVSCSPSEIIHTEKFLPDRIDSDWNTIIIDDCISPLDYTVATTLEKLRPYVEKNPTACVAVSYNGGYCPTTGLACDYIFNGGTSLVDTTFNKSLPVAEFINEINELKLNKAEVIELAKVRLAYITEQKPSDWMLGGGLCLSHVDDKWYHDEAFRQEFPGLNGHKQENDIFESVTIGNVTVRECRSSGALLREYFGNDVMGNFLARVQAERQKVFDNDRKDTEDKVKAILDILDTVKPSANAVQEKAEVQDEVKPDPVPELVKMRTEDRIQFLQEPDDGTTIEVKRIPSPLPQPPPIPNPPFTISPVQLVQPPAPNPIPVEIPSILNEAKSITLRPFDLKGDTYLVAGTDFVVVQIDMYVSGKPGSVQSILVGVRTGKEFDTRPPSRQEAAAASQMGIMLLDKYDSLSSSELPY